MSQLPVILFVDRATIPVQQLYAKAVEGLSEHLDSIPRFLATAGK